SAGSFSTTPLRVRRQRTRWRSLGWQGPPRLRSGREVATTGVYSKEPSCRGKIARTATNAVDRRSLCQSGRFASEPGGGEISDGPMGRGAMLQRLLGGRSRALGPAEHEGGEETNHERQTGDKDCPISPEGHRP